MFPRGIAAILFEGESLGHSKERRMFFHSYSTWIVEYVMVLHFNSLIYTDSLQEFCGDRVSIKNKQRDSGL